MATEPQDLRAIGFELMLEIGLYGSVRQPGAVLRHDQHRSTYRMNAERDVFDRHELDVANTPPERLAAHWLGFAQAKREVR